MSSKRPDESVLCKQPPTIVGSATPDDAAALQGQRYIDQQDSGSSERYRGNDIQDVINALHGVSRFKFVGRFSLSRVGPMSSHRHFVSSVSPFRFSR